MQFQIPRYTNLSRGIAYTQNVNRSRDSVIYVGDPRGCPVSPLTYLESENRITSISSAASGPFRFSRAPSSLYLVVESLCLPRSRARSYNAGAAIAERGSAGGFYARFIDLSPSTFTLPSHMPHPTSAFPPASHFSRRVARRCRQARKEKPGKQDIFCLLNTPRTEVWWSPVGTRAQRASG